MVFFDVDSRSKALGEKLLSFDCKVVHHHFAEVKRHLCIPHVLCSQAGTAFKLSARSLFELPCMKMGRRLVKLAA